MAFVVRRTRSACRGATGPRRTFAATFGAVVCLVVAAGVASAGFSTSTGAVHTTSTASLTGDHAPADGTNSFSATPAASVSCTVAWSSLDGGTAVADRYEVRNASTGASVATPGNVNAGLATVTQRSLTGRYQLLTRRGPAWVAAGADTKLATCSLGDLTSVSAGQSATCGIRVDGTLWCWGFGVADGTTGDATRFTRSSPNQVGVATNWQQVSVGGSVACGVRSDSTGWCWGNNWAGALGNGTTTSSTAPVQVPGAWRRIAAGGGSACGIRADLALACWGLNWSGQLGIGSTTNATSPALVGAGPWAYVSVGDAHACGLTAAQTLHCWGANWNAQVGDGTYTNAVAPVQLGGAWTAVHASLVTTCAIKADATLWCWGANGWNQGGQASSADILVPTQVGTAATWARVATGRYTSCGVQSDATLWCWGANAFGADGSGSAGWSTHDDPERVGSASDWIDVSSFSLHSCALRTGGAVSCFGAAGVGATGQGGTAWQTWAQVGTASDYGTVSVGAAHSCAIRTTATLWCWGANYRAQLGSSGAESTASPVQITAGSGANSTFLAVAAGGEHTCAVRNDQQLYCWGAGDSGQTGLGTTDWIDAPTRVGTSVYSTVSASAVTTCAIRTNQTLWCWGSNSTGALGDGTTTDRTSPVQVAGSWLDVSTAPRHTCGVKTDGTAWCWGSNATGALGDGTLTNRTSPVRAGTATNYTQISAGDAHSCGRRSDSTASCWGDNSYGQLGNGTTTASSVPVAVIGGGGVARVDAATGWVCATSSTAVLYCAGRNVTGAFGVGSLSGTNTFPVQAMSASVTAFDGAGGGHHECLVKAGVVWCAGANEWAQLGSLMATSTPAAVAGPWKS